MEFINKQKPEIVLTKAEAFDLAMNLLKDINRLDNENKNPLVSSTTTLVGVENFTSINDPDEVTSVTKIINITVEK